MSGRLIPHTNPRAWKQVLASMGGHDVYHLPEYQLIDRPEGDGRAFLYVFEDDRSRLALPFMLRPPVEADWVDEPFLDATSAYGYPGPLVGPESVLEGGVPSIMDDLSGCLREIGVVSLFVRCHPMLTRPELSERYGDQAGETVWIDLTLPLEQQVAESRGTHRASTRKAREAGIEVFHDDGWSGLDEFVEIYEERMAAISASESYFFPGSYYRRLRDELGKSVKLVHAKRDGAIVASALFFLSGEGIQYHLAGTRAEARSLGPMRVILEEVRAWGVDQGYRWFHLGGGVGGQRDSLMEFKSGFGPGRRSFRVLRLVADQERYDDLCRRHANASAGSVEGQGFFPPYLAG